jgi:hypothetical protein
MPAHRILLYAAISLALSIVIFIFNLLFFAKPLYVLYADLFQSGQMYQGETRAFIYNRFLLTVIAPYSLLLGSALTWVLKAFKWVALVLAALIFALVIAAFAWFEPVDETPPFLHDHPNAYWSGAQDGGSFFEITRAEPPRYFVEIRHENGDIWSTGWVSDQGRPLKSSDLWGYDGGDVVYIKNGTKLSLE